VVRTIVAFTAFFAQVHHGFAQADEKNRNANKPVPPFRIAGNLYYVGAAEVTSYLITTPEGHFLLDGGYVETAPQIQHNISQLGFKLTDVKFLLTSHAHFDHAGGLAELKKATGAKLLASEPDAALLRSGGRGDFRFGDTLPFPPIAADQIIQDGEVIRLGQQEMVAHLTPGHTKGCTTWTTKIDRGSKTYSVVFVGSQSALDYKFVGQESYPGIKRDFERSFALLKTLPCDIFLATHGSMFNLKDKCTRLSDGDTNAFVDPDGYETYLRESEQDFRNKRAQQEREPHSNEGD
jgi:metallo-beta-lactamase class B